MLEKISKRLRNALNELNWELEPSADGIRLQLSNSHLWDQFQICIADDSEEEIVKHIQEYASTFDADEYADEWLARRCDTYVSIPTAREMIILADQIKSVLLKLSERLAKLPDESDDVIYILSSRCDPGVCEETQNIIYVSREIKKVRIHMAKCVLEDARDNFFPVDEADDYVTVYEGGDENSRMWIEYFIEKHSVM